MIGKILGFLQKENKPLTSLLGDKHFFALFPMLKGFGKAAVDEIIASADFNDVQKNNVAVAVMIFYILTKGEYPQELWRNSALKYSETLLGQYSARGKEFAEFVRKNLDDKPFSEINAFNKRIIREQKKKDIAEIISDLRGVGAYKLFEMLWDVFITKYGHYSVKIWLSKISEFADKNYAHRCEYRIRNKRSEIYAVSSEGKLDKPLHLGCEDHSLVKFISESCWIAVVADGVGSCEHSSVGSEAASVALEQTVVNHLLKKGFLVSKSKVSVTDKKDDIPEELMDYFKSRFAKEFYSKWEKTIKLSAEYKKSPSEDVSPFGTTFQFAFGFKKLIACGRLGDGGFFVRLKGNNDKVFGGFNLNDGISGVVRPEVFTVSHLKNSPQLLRIDFFDAGEVSDIVITSDGMLGALGETVVKREAFVRKYVSMLFTERCRALSDLADACADYNETNCGNGDDSSIAFIHFI